MLHTRAVRSNEAKVLARNSQLLFQERKKLYYKKSATTKEETIGSGSCNDLF